MAPPRRGKNEDRKFVARPRSNDARHSMTAAERKATRNKRKQRRRPLKPKLDPDEPVPQDPAEFRLALARRMNTFSGSWRECDESLCKRRRACRGWTISCSLKGPQVTPEQGARAAAKLKRLLDQMRPVVDDEAGTGNAANNPGAVSGKRVARVTR